MRILLVLLLGAVLAASAAEIVVLGQVVKLDTPEALEQLKRDKPDHYAKVVEAMDQVQAVPSGVVRMENLLWKTLKPDLALRLVEPSFPARTHITVPVEGVVYEVTVFYTKNLPTLIPAK
jgi:hypothetical protein